MHEELQASMNRLNHGIAALVEESRTATAQWAATVQAHVTRWERPLDTQQYDQLAEACWDTVLQRERRNAIRRRAGSIRYHLHGKQKEKWSDEEDSDLDD